MEALSPAQKSMVEYAGNLLVVGVPGSGKTRVLLERAVWLSGRGEKVALVTFAYRNFEYMKARAEKDYPGLWNRILAGTVRDVAANQLTASGVSYAFITNNQVRELLRGLIVSQSFPGTLEDAETLVRTAKGRARKMAEADRYFPFVQAYKDKLDQMGLMDRHDILRRHVLGMQDKSVPPLPVTHLLVDNVQDATELQLIWLQKHVAAGVKVSMAADDDCTLFGPAGALGPEAIYQIEKWGNVTRVDLPGTYRLPKTLAPAVLKVARQLRSRVAKPDDNLGKTQGRVMTEVFENAPAEHTYVANRARELMEQGKTVGILTRTDFQASVVGHALRKRGINPASFARLVWEEPTPKIILSLLYLMLNQASNGHLHLVLLGFGMPEEAIVSLFENGLMAQDWMPRGCPLPEIPEASPTTLLVAQRFRRACRSAWQLWQAKRVNPQDVFKILVGELLPNLEAAEQPTALLATDLLLSLSGKLTEILPRVRTETLPDMTSPVTVAPVREVRNMEFDAVILPYFSPETWPHPASALLGANPDHERRTAYLALTRSRGDVIITRHAAQPSPFLAELEQALAKAK